MSFKSVMENVGLKAKTDAVDSYEYVETKIGVMSSATKKSLQTYFSTKTVAIQGVTGFNGNKFYISTLDGTVMNEFETYEELNTFVAANAPNDDPADLAVQTAAPAVVVPVVKTEADKIQDQIVALQAQQVALKEQE